MYKSVGKLLRSLTTVRRCGASCAAMESAALITLNRLIEVLSVATTSPGPAPISVAILSPSRAGMVYQPAVFQERIRPSPHSWSTAAATRARAALGSGPRELPSR